ncbi:MAG TPA: PQQ-binding-like beta-propeller repeat protein [Verrucomicrobiae bacterium]|nr:PQQ-binding-like beta-propeller repeat protein [Verrucomicrobiae bacterium]
MELKKLARFLAIAALLVTSVLRGDDWPQWMGPKRDGVWRERGIIEKIPTNGLATRWRVPVNPGYCGPAVAGHHLYMMDRVPAPVPERKRGDKSVPSLPGRERVFSLDTTTGKLEWEQSYDCPYRIGYPSGPRATPIVAGARIYTLGAMGDLFCRNAADGKVVWERHFLADFGLTEPQTWGWAAHPLLDGDRLICLVGGTNSVVVAFHKDTGKELWRALGARETAYAPPMIYPVGKQRQLIIWLPDALAGLEPRDGKVLWTKTYPVAGKTQRPGVTIATPRLDGNRLFVTSFYDGATLLELHDKPPGASVVWNRHSSSNSEFNDGLHTTMCTPVFKDGYIYGVCGAGELRCLDAKTGDRKWETFDVTGGKAGLFANAFLIQQADRCWIWNDQGELILGKLSPNGFEKLGSAKLLEPVENTRGRDVLWCHPAFANRDAYMHNGHELICVPLGKESGLSEKAKGSRG